MAMSSGSEHASGSYNGDSYNEDSSDRLASAIMDEPADAADVEATSRSSFEEKELAVTSELSKYLSVYDQTFDKIQIPPDVVEDVQTGL